MEQIDHSQTEGKGSHPHDAPPPSQAPPRLAGESALSPPQSAFPSSCNLDLTQPLPEWAIAQRARGLPIKFGYIRPGSMQDCMLRQAARPSGNVKKVFQAPSEPLKLTDVLNPEYFESRKGRHTMKYLMVWLLRVHPGMTYGDMFQRDPIFFYGCKGFGWHALRTLYRRLVEYGLYPPESWERANAQG